jgi:hypothetical protein
MLVQSLIECKVDKNPNECSFIFQIIILCILQLLLTNQRKDNRDV